MVYDAADGYVVLYSGATALNDTWIFSNGNWSRLSASTLPPPHSWACMTYDWATGYVVLFGGGESGAPGSAPTRVFNDTWTYHAGVWTNITSTVHGPPSMMYMSCTYDAADGYVLLFGGSTGKGTAPIGTSGPQVLTLNQTWKFAAGVWTNLTSYSAPHPSARYGAAMAYDTVDKYVVLYGGAINNTATAAGFCSSLQCPHYNQTWKYAGGTWTNISATASATHGTPPGRWAVSMTNDTADGYLITFGGQDNGLKVASTTGNYTWTFDGGIWSNVSSLQAHIPGTRFGAAITYAPSSGVVIMFSGHGSTVVNSSSPDDTWFFIDGEWTSNWFTSEVTFTESGLPATDTWYVNVTGGPNLETSGATTSLTAILANGTYDFTVATNGRIYAPSYTRDFTVNGVAVLVTVGFSLTTNTVTFTETGLPAETRWSVVVNAVSLSSTESSITFQEANGSYTYSVTSGSTLYVPSYTPSFTVSGAPVSNGVTFSLVVYPVTFDVSGLPATDTWYVNVTGGPNLEASGATTSLTTNLANGTHEFTLATNDTPYAPSYTPSFTINGGPTSVNVTFTLFTYAVTFMETGLPVGDTWYANITGGASLSTTGVNTNLSANLANGSYNLTIATNDTCYAPTYTPGFTISGIPTTVNVTFSPTYALTFLETGLPSGTSWSVTLGANEQSSASNSITFQEANGSYTYSVTSGSTLYAPSYTPSFTVSGAPVSNGVTFSLVVYPVTFDVSGLPATDTWYVNVTGGPNLEASGATTSLTTNLANGTYSFIVATNDKRYAPSYAPGFTVSGTPVSVSLSFTLFTYLVTFKEDGLPSGTSWNVTLSSVTHSSVANTITFRAANGTFTYWVAVTSGGISTGTFTVSGAPLTVLVNFYKVSFTESGLPTGTCWRVTTNGVAESSTGTSIVFFIPNGTYGYYIGLISGYHAADSGTYVVSGASVTIHPGFSKTTYTVKFSATGFTASWKTKWCVTFNSVTSCTTSSSITFTQIANGTYSYTIGHVTNYSLGISYTGTVTVAGGGQGTTSNTVNVPWRLLTYAVTFTEKGLPKGTKWQVTLNGLTKSTTGSSVSFSEPNGTYSYTVSTGAAYSPNPSSGSETVNGTSSAVVVSFTSQASSGSALLVSRAWREAESH